MISFDVVRLALKEYGSRPPFDYCVIDGLFEHEVADKLSAEFPDYGSAEWFYYKNPLEDKKALNDWNAFPPLTYQAFSLLQARETVALFEAAVGKRLYADQGLHGGGWHIHESGGNLNPHLDYSIHPKLGLQRKLNIIVYLSKELQPEHGGHLGFWAHDSQTNEPGELVTEIEPRFNRAVLFDTTQNSWHGMSKPFTPPGGIYRKSFAVYYLCDPAPDAAARGRALYAPRPMQRGDPEIERIIRLRSGIDTSQEVYRTEKS
jgi:hypothetical protein